MLVTETVTERNCKRSIYTTWCENVIDITRLISFWLSMHGHCRGGTSHDRPAHQGLNRLLLHKRTRSQWPRRWPGGSGLRGPALAVLTSCIKGCHACSSSSSSSISSLSPLFPSPFSPPTVRTSSLGDPLS